MYALALKGKTSPDLLTALSSSLTYQMDKKGKKALRHPVSKVYASQAATINLAAARPSAVSTPNKPKNTKKEPVVMI
ncbi:hypothetical protein PIB30_065793 [Stylosanthes scabra]|uniref:Uncharacterized protein n=1 Tax=Stylosanthes scabra TaxID=79078 RepID=A0ABU6ZKV1_9FABA|nr:hypothetical protein [Stylosanthes scabra]